MRFLLLIGLICAAWWWAVRALAPRKPSQSSSGREAVKMVACAHCGVFVPVQEALAQDDRWYCTKAHLQAGKDSSTR